VTIDVMARDDAVSTVAREVRELVRRRGLDPVGDRAGL
jgi:pilus assembly protein CpaF